MSLDVVGLSKLLQIIYASKSRQTALLRTDIRSDIRKSAGEDTSTGGDFYGPFWADVKGHVAGFLDLKVATEGRIAKNERRRKLYTLLQQNFLLWWEQKRRLRNEPFTLINENIKARLVLDGLGTVKIDNTLCITVGEDGHRIFYPYFCESPALSAEAARLGLWAMSQAIGKYALEDMRLLDVARGRSFSVLDTPLQGNESELFHEKYAEARAAWQALRDEYDV